MGNSADCGLDTFYLHITCWVKLSPDDILIYFFIFLLKGTVRLEGDNLNEMSNPIFLGK